MPNPNLAQIRVEFVGPVIIVPFVRWLLMTFLLLGSLAVGAAAETPVGRVVKVLPMFLDQQGRDSLTPSLYDRDAYQVQLREHPQQRSALRVDILWNAAHTGAAPLKLRVELRGIGTNSLPQQITLERPVTTRWFRKWTSLLLGGEDYQKCGDVTAWRVTLWSGGQRLGEQKSFLW